MWWRRRRWCGGDAGDGSGVRADPSYCCQVVSNAADAALGHGSLIHEVLRSIAIMESLLIFCTKKDGNRKKTDKIILRSQFIEFYYEVV